MESGENGERVQNIYRRPSWPSGIVSKREPGIERLQ